MANWRRSPLLVVSAILHLIALIIAPRRWRTALSIVVANHVAIFLSCLFPRSPLLGPNTRRIPNPGNAIALTFDDGPDAALTPKVLDLLDAAGAKATFFCLGANVEAHRGLVAEMRRRGHDVQNHTHTHPNLFALQSPARMSAQIDAAQDAIEKASGERPCFFRAPAGFLNPFLFPLLEKKRMTLVSWTRRGFDTMTPDADLIAKRLTRNLKAGDILVLHDRMPVTLQVLPIVLEALAQEGLRSERLGVLLPAR